MVQLFVLQAATAPVVVTAAGSAIRPAWPTSCCSTSVAPRMPLCICVRFQIVACVLVILSSARDGRAGDEQHDRHGDDQFDQGEAGILARTDGSRHQKGLVFNTTSVDDAFMAPPKPRAIVAVTVIRFRHENGGVALVHQEGETSSTRQTRW